MYVVEPLLMATIPTPHNLRYLTTKRDRLGHQLETLETQAPPAAEVS